MPDNATVYAPIHFFPSEAQLRPLIGDAAANVDMEAQRATITWSNGPSIRLSRMPDQEMPQHLSGLRGYIGKQGGSEGLAIRAMSTLSVYGLVIEPGFDETGRAMGFVAALTGATDGLCFLSGDIVDRTGASLLAGGAASPAAERVAARALVLLTLSFRSLLEQDANTEDESEAEELRQQLVTWLKNAPGVEAEAEERERALIEAPIGDGDGQAITDGVWRAEGAQVLLWALGARDLPAHDEQEHPYDVARAVGVLGEGPPKLYENLSLRTPEDLSWMRRRLLGIHWRLTENRVNPGNAVDFVKFASDNWFGGFDLNGIATAEGDIAVAGETLARADAGRVSLASSTAMERHVAINWLVGAHPLYSRVATPT